MKTLGKLKLLGMSVLILMGMSACIKSNDPGFAIIGSVGYVEQFGTGDNAKFKPAIQFQANEPIKQAVAKYDGKTYMFTKMDETGYLMELDRYMGPSLSDTIPTGYFTITASNVEGEVAPLQMKFSADKKLGGVEMKGFECSATGTITAKWNKVENAVAYYLVYKTTGNMWNIYRNLQPNGSEELSASLTLTLVKDQEYTFAIAAVYQSLLTVGVSMDVTGGTPAVAH